jgi:RNA polymerase sigma-70 factor (ECF subfamily)
MMATREPDTEQLLQRTAQGDQAALQQLLVRHQTRLLRLIGLRLDRRVAARIDPADVLQEALLEAVRRLPEYLRQRPLPFYPWLRQLALDRLADLHRLHLRSQKRSVGREERLVLDEQSALELANRLLARDSSPSARLQRSELRARLEGALARLGEADREILVLRHLEQLSAAEIAAVLGIREGAVYTRHLRALERLRRLLGDDPGEEQP